MSGPFEPLERLRSARWSWRWRRCPSPARPSPDPHRPVCLPAPSRPCRPRQDHGRPGRRPSTTVTLAQAPRSRPPGRRRHDDDVDHRRAQDARHRGRGYRDQRPEPLSAVPPTAPRPKIVGYQISEQVQVTVQDLDRRVTRSTWRTRRAPPTSTGSGSKSAIRQRPKDDARSAAVGVPDHAQALAAAGNVSLGAVVGVSDSTPPF